MITLENEGQIYFRQIREYFKEIVSDYSNGNYRSAIVMLYSVTICDLLLKLQELVDVYKDDKAEKIIDEIKTIQNNSKSKSSWEKELIDKVYKNTELLNIQAYTELSHLYDQRNFSAHPVMNENYELVVPSKEITLAHIVDVLNNILVKPPMFMNNIVNVLSDDIAEKKENYHYDIKQFKNYLTSKYYDKMSDSMKKKVFSAFWKFCFSMPEDKNCMENIEVNRYMLEIILDKKGVTMEDIKNILKKYSVANNEDCYYNMAMLLSKFPEVYKYLDDLTLCGFENFKNVHRIRAISWFETDNKTHIQHLKTEEIGDIESEEVKYIFEMYSNAGLKSNIIKYYISVFEKSESYDMANDRFDVFIHPYLKSFDEKDYQELLYVINSNDQIYGRWRASRDNQEILNYAKKYLNIDLYYDEFKNFCVA